MTVRQRKPSARVSSKPVLLQGQGTSKGHEMKGIGEMLRRQPVWMVLAVASGACAAFNGVFAKLTTTALTSSLASHIATAFSLSPDNKVVDVAIRAFFFGMNLLFNAAMWALFTAALTRADSTTRVSIINVSANFMITAVLGWMIFGEKLPPLWWLGASLLAAGNVVIGRREEQKPGGTVRMEEAEDLLGQTREGHTDDLVELDDGDLISGTNSGLREEQARIRKGEDVDAPI